MPWRGFNINGRTIPLDYREVDRRFDLADDQEDKRRSAVRKLEKERDRYRAARAAKMAERDTLVARTVGLEEEIGALERL
ncbi:hypothetical protein G6514_008355 [Epicoccum nigrum]|nr:hypothetical protein G6514_008355 [Epicoccum nigrum]